MNREQQDDPEIFYSFFSAIKPRQHQGTSTQNEWQFHVLPHSAID
ncbi:hypothetical protein [Myxosarcina sp. GI1(2024)]